MILRSLVFMTLSLCAATSSALQFSGCRPEDVQVISELSEIVGSALEQRQQIGERQGIAVYPMECKEWHSSQDYAQRYAEYSQIFTTITDYFSSSYTINCDYRADCFAESEGCNDGGALGCATIGLPHMSLCMRKIAPAHTTGTSQRRFAEGLVRLLLHEMAHSAGYRHTQHGVDGRVHPVSFKYLLQPPVEKEAVHRRGILKAICEFNDWQRNPDTFGVVGYWLVRKDAPAEIANWERIYQRPALSMAPRGR